MKLEERKTSELVIKNEVKKKLERLESEKTRLGPREEQAILEKVKKDKKVGLGQEVVLKIIRKEESDYKKIQKERGLRVKRSKSQIKNLKQIILQKIRKIIMGGNRKLKQEKIERLREQI